MQCSLATAQPAVRSIHGFVTGSARRRLGERVIENARCPPAERRVGNRISAQSCPAPPDRSRSHPRAIHAGGGPLVWGGVRGAETCWRPTTAMKRFDGSPWVEPSKGRKAGLRLVSSVCAASPSTDKLRSFSLIPRGTTPVFTVSCRRLWRPWLCRYPTGRARSGLPGTTSPSDSTANMCAC